MALQVRVLISLAIAITVTDEMNVVFGSSSEFGCSASEQAAVRQKQCLTAADDEKLGQCFAYFVMHLLRVGIAPWVHDMDNRVVQSYDLNSDICNLSLELFEGFEHVAFNVVIIRRQKYTIFSRHVRFSTFLCFDIILKAHYEVVLITR